MLNKTLLQQLFIHWFIPQFFSCASMHGLTL